MSVSPFYSFVYFFPSSQNDLVPRKRSMFGLKRAVKSNCQAALFDGVLSFTRLSVKDNRCHQTQTWSLTFSRRTFQLRLKGGHVWYVIKNISKPLFDRQQIWVRPVWKNRFSQQCHTFFWQNRKFPGPWSVSGLLRHLLTWESCPKASAVAQQPGRNVPTPPSLLVAPCSDEAADELLQGKNRWEASSLKK